MQTLAGLSLVFLILAVFFVCLERIWPGVKGQPVQRRGWWTDLTYWFFTPIVTREVTQFCVTIVAVLLLLILGKSLNRESLLAGFAPLGRQPAWLQALEMFLIADFISYWLHRWFHGPRLWAFHAVHHSSPELDWLSATRVHPVNDVVQRIVTTIPLLALGFTPTAAAVVAPFSSFYAITLHANVNWKYGPLKYVIASPVFHRWHHCKNPEAVDKNFAGLFPIYDLLFGTFYMPDDKLPEDFGVHDPVPENLIGQLVYPFKTPPINLPPQTGTRDHGLG